MRRLTICSLTLVSDKTVAHSSLNYCFYFAVASLLMRDTFDRKSVQQHSGQTNNATFIHNIVWWVLAELAHVIRSNILITPAYKVMYINQFGVRPKRPLAALGQGQSNS